MNTSTEQRSGSPATAALPHVREVLRAAEHELAELLSQRADDMKRIATVKQTLTGMATLFGDSILNDDLRMALGAQVSGRRKGFAEACRQIKMF
jgi:hypothetical protein